MFMSKAFVTMEQTDSNRSKVDGGAAVTPAVFFDVPTTTSAKAGDGDLKLQSKVGYNPK